MGNTAGALCMDPIVIEDQPQQQQQYFTQNHQMHDSFSKKETEMTSRERLLSASEIASVTTEASTVAASSTMALNHHLFEDTAASGASSVPLCFGAGWWWFRREPSKYSVLMIPEEDEDDLDDEDDDDHRNDVQGSPVFEVSGNGPLDSILTLSATSSSSSTSSFPLDDEQGMLNGEAVMDPEADPETDCADSADDAKRDEPPSMPEDTECTSQRSRADSSASPMVRARARTRSIDVVNVYQTDHSMLDTTTCGTCHHHQPPPQRLPFRTCKNDKCNCQSEKVSRQGGLVEAQISSDCSLECTYSSSSGESSRVRRGSHGPPIVRRPSGRDLTTIAPLPKPPRKSSATMTNTSKQRSRSEDIVDLPSPRMSPDVLDIPNSAPKFPPSLSVPFSNEPSPNVDALKKKPRAPLPYSPTSVVDHPGKTRPNRAAAVRRAQQLERHGRLVEAIDAYRECIKQQRRTRMHSLHKGAEHTTSTTLATLYHHLGTLHWKMGAYRPSLRVLEQAMEQTQLAHGCLTTEDTFLVATARTKHFLSDLLVSTARALLSLGQWSDAKATIQQALRLLEDAAREETTHESSCVYAKAIVYLGMINEIENDRERAIQLYQEALHRQQYSLGQMHPDVAFTLSCLGNAYLECGWLGPAMSHCCEAMRIYRLVSCPVDVGNSLVTIGWIHASYGNIPAALAATTDGYQMLHAQLGDHHRNVRSAQLQIGLLYAQLGNVQLALQVYKEIYNQLLNSASCSPLDLAATLDAIAFGYESMRKVKKATSFVHRALDLRQESLGEDHVQVQWTRQHLDGLTMVLSGGNNEKMNVV